MEFVDEVAKLADFIGPIFFDDGQGDIWHGEVGLDDVIDAAAIFKRAIFIGARFVEEGGDDLLEDGAFLQGVLLQAVALVEDVGSVALVQQIFDHVRFKRLERGVIDEIIVMVEGVVEAGDALDFASGIAAVEIRRNFTCAGIFPCPVFGEIIGVEIVAIFKLDAVKGDIAIGDEGLVEGVGYAIGIEGGVVQII